MATLTSKSALPKIKLDNFNLLEGLEIKPNSTIAGPVISELYAKVATQNNLLFSGRRPALAYQAFTIRGTPNLDTSTLMLTFFGHQIKRDCTVLNPSLYRGVITQAFDPSLDIGDLYNNTACLIKGEAIILNMNIDPQFDLPYDLVALVLTEDTEVLLFTTHGLRYLTVKGGVLTHKKGYEAFNSADVTQEGGN